MPARIPTMTALLRHRSSLCRQLRVSRRQTVKSFNYSAPAPLAATCDARAFATRSVSAIKTVENDAFHAGSKRQIALSDANSTNESADSNDMLYMLEQSIAKRQPSEALAYYNCLESPPSGLTSQKLAILLAKQDAPHQTRRAFEILQAVYGSPGFKVDDYTQLASIYIVDACLRQKLVLEALEVVNHAHMSDISLDLPAYDNLLRTLVEADDLSRARLILMDVVAKKHVILEQQSFQPLLITLMQRAEYDSVVDIIDHGRKNGVVFTFETYDPLVEMGEDVDDSDNEELWSELERFMCYINEALEEDGLTSFSDDDDDDDNEDSVPVAIGFDNDDDDDEDFDEDFDDNKY